jgi:hypothetical protein
MHGKVLAYLAALPLTLRINLIDASSIATFDGAPSAFYDGVHMKVRNVRPPLR